MEFIQSIDFTLVALVICFIYEALGKSFNNYVLASTGGMKVEDIGYSNCLVGLFYIVFIFAMLWNPILWLPALLLIAISFITGGVTRVPMQRIKELRASGVSEDYHEIKKQKSIAQVFWTIDKILSIGLLSWMIYLHLQVIGIIA